MTSSPDASDATEALLKSAGLAPASQVTLDEPTPDDIGSGELGIDTAESATPSRTSGSSAGFDEAFPELYKIAYRVAFRILGNRAEAEDVAQDTLSKAYSRWWRLKNDPERWVSRASANRAIDVWRRRRTQELTPAELLRAENGEPVLERLALVDALSRLSRRQREVVVLRYLAGYPEADVAEILDCSVGSVKTHASRGLSNLRTDAVLGRDV